MESQFLKRPPSCGLDNISKSFQRLDKESISTEFEIKRNKWIVFSFDSSRKNKSHVEVK